MKIRLASNSHCTGCAACVDSCHQQALRMRYDKNGFLHPVADGRLCVECGACEKVCPILNHDSLPVRDVQAMRYYAAWSEDEEVCRHSSSGGIFSQIAVNLLREGNAVVFGVEATVENTCHHRSISHVEELPAIAGTKYIQSNAEGSYRETRKALTQGRKVLYCGTPCQIAGLYATLGYKDRENLYTADLICHGVASKITADIATSYVGADHIHSYRDKNEGWCKPGLVRVSPKNTYSMPDGTLYRPEKNLFWACFATTHRISCTRCPFAQLSRLGDLSLGDLWGLYKHYPNRGELGVSLVICNTPKGEGLLRSGQITAIEHEKKRLNCYTMFYPGASRYAQWSEWLFLIKKLPTHTAYHLLSLDWRKNPFLLPVKALFITASHFHLKHTLAAIQNTKHALGWD